MDPRFRGINLDNILLSVNDSSASSQVVLSSSQNNNNNNNNIGIIDEGEEEDEVNEDCDLSDAVLGFISQVLMEEDMEDKTCMLSYESLHLLHASEKSFYDVIGKKYPPSPSPSQSPISSSSTTDDGSLFSVVDKYIESPNDIIHFHDNHNNNNDHHLNLSSSSSSSGTNNVVDGSSDNTTTTTTSTTFYGSDICDENEMMMIKFKKGVEEANKFLPSEKKLVDYNGVAWGSSLVKKDQLVKVDGRNLSTGSSRVRKSPFGEDGDDMRSLKQAAIFQDSTLRTNEIDLILLCSMGQGDVALRLMRNTLRSETGKDKLKDKEPKDLVRGKGKGRARKPKNKKQVIDLRTLLVTCAQAVAADDRRNATELLKQIRQHASPFGDGSQRLAHCFANGLEARLAGTGSQIHRGLVSKKTSAADYIKAYYLYIASSPFRKISNFASNRTIMDMAKDATRIHVIDFGILYGFQWPTFIQRISQRKGGPPRLRLTGIEFPQPGFRPSERIEETGARLKEYAKQFNVPFEYNAIAKRWENVNVEDLKIDKDEFLVVNCMYRSKNLLDETVGVDSARNVVLGLIKKINPNIFIHGILNGSYNAPFFLTRFREALFHFSALFDMLETNVPRERSERMLLEGELFGREALNVIACEGWERIERPETYKQWHVRNLRAGFVSVPFSQFVIKLSEEKVGLYHKDFMIDLDNNWLLQGWKGRIIYAISCWKTA